jgi:hypothetical protein
LINDKDWRTLKEYNRASLIDAEIGDIFVAQNLESGDIEGRYIKRNYKKRGYQCVENEGYLSVYDISTVHSKCKFVKYAKTN